MPKISDMEENFTYPFLMHMMGMTISSTINKPKPNMVAMTMAMLQSTPKNARNASMEQTSGTGKLQKMKTLLVLVTSDFSRKDFG
jgi:hypothetical protein